MGEKQGKVEKKESKGGEKKNKADQNKKEEKKKDADGGVSTVIMVLDIHCEGCALKIKKSVKIFEGVDEVSTDMANNKLTVTGKVDPSKIRERVESKTRRNVDLISPVNPPKKGSEEAKKPQSEPKEQKKPQDTKPKEPAVSTVVLNIRLHCQGCIQKIRRTILKVKGVENVNIDSQKDWVTVKGAVDASNLAAYLREKLKRSVEIVPQKKEGGGGGDEKKEKGGENKKKSDEKKGKEDEKKKEKGGEKKGNEGEKKNRSKGGEQEQAAAMTPAPAPAVERNKMEYFAQPYGGYRIETVHAPQLFSDENPNACSIM